MTIDPIMALESFGYTEREAAFLYLVAIHSGYFLRRQFNYSIDRRLGSLAHHFIEKARVAGHVEVIDYGQGRFVYHLYSKPIYRLLGNAESQNRRRKGDAMIRARLMALDYVLENNDEHYLETEQEKLNYFCKVRGIASEFFMGEQRRLHDFIGMFPISLADREHPASSLVRLAFMDEGLLSLRKFSRFLTDVVPLLYALERFEVIYAATSERNFSSARELFRRHFAPTPISHHQTLGDFRRDSVPTRVANHSATDATFTTVLFEYTYPKLLRNEPQESARQSHIQSLNQEEIA